MEDKEFIEWLEKKNLLSIVKNQAVYFRNVLVNSLGLNKDDKQEVLIVGDFGSHGKRISPLLIGSYYLAAKSLNLNVKIEIQHPKKIEEISDKNIIRSLSELKNNSYILINISNKLGSLKELGGSFRGFCKAKGHRFISTIGVGNLETKDFYFITRALNIDYGALRLKANEIKQKLDNGKELKIISEAGTNIIADIRGVSAIAIDGDYTNEKLGGNMPVGEVYIAPNNVNGEIVIDGSSRNRDGTILIEKPIYMEVRNRSIVKINGEKEAKLLKDSLDWAMARAKAPSNTNKIGEIGIGLNSKANIIGAMVVDEKASGTAHVGIGSNYWFGGDIFTFIHLDQVLRKPKIFIDGEEIKTT